MVSLKGVGMRKERVIRLNRLESVGYNCDATTVRAGANLSRVILILIPKLFAET